MRSSRSTKGGKTEGSAVRCSVARGPRFFKWKMLRESLVTFTKIHHNGIQPEGAP